MKFYVTSESVQKLRRMINNLSSFYIMDIDRMLNEMLLDSNAKPHRFVINSEISRMLASASRSKRYLGVIYVYKGINRTGISGLRNAVFNVKNGVYEVFNIIDFAETPKHDDLYDLFDEVVYVSSYKKNRL